METYIRFIGYSGPGYTWSVNIDKAGYEALIKEALKEDDINYKNDYLGRIIISGPHGETEIIHTKRSQFVKAYRLALILDKDQY